MDTPGGQVTKWVEVPLRLRITDIAVVHDEIGETRPSSPLENIGGMPFDSPMDDEFISEGSKNKVVHTL